MKSDKNRIDLGIEFSDVKQLQKAFDKVIEKFNADKISGDFSGGNYFTCKYSIIRELNIAQKKVIHTEQKTELELIDEKVMIDSREFQDEGTGNWIHLIPSRLNY